MKQVFSLPQTGKALIFDIDGTLYTSPAYVFEQVDAQVRHFAHLRGMEEKEARARIADFRKAWSAAHGGRKISLGNTLTHFGISIEESIAWRNTLLEPSRYLKEDKMLYKELVLLKKDYTLVCVTNNPVPAAQKTLEAIGVADLLPTIVGLDTCHESKPSRKMLEVACTLAEARFEECISIGDRYDIDIALPLSLGMGGIVVSGVEDVYGLHDFLKGGFLQ